MPGSYTFPHAHFHQPPTGLNQTWRDSLLWPQDLAVFVFFAKCCPRQTINTLMIYHFTLTGSTTSLHLPSFLRVSLLLWVKIPCF